MDGPPNEEVIRYIENAEEVLEVARLMLINDYYTSAINRAYYAIFYSAMALLITEGRQRVKHSSVISAFRQYFVKSGRLKAELSEIYGRVMADRHVSDYELDSDVTKQDARADIAGAEKFVSEVKKYLETEGWL